MAGRGTEVRCDGAHREDSFTSWRLRHDDRRRGTRRCAGREVGPCDGSCIVAAARNRDDGGCASRCAIDGSAPRGASSNAAASIAEYCVHFRQVLYSPRRTNRRGRGYCVSRTRRDISSRSGAASSAAATASRIAADHSAPRSTSLDSSVRAPRTEFSRLRVTLASSRPSYLRHSVSVITTSDRFLGEAAHDQAARVMIDAMPDGHSIGGAVRAARGPRRIGPHVGSFTPDTTSRGGAQDPDVTSANDAVRSEAVRIQRRAGFTFFDMMKNV
jgi:hypothetical protein